MNQIAKNPDRGTGTERKCIATGEVQPKFGLIRFVVGPDQHIVPDVLGKLPGRGIWVSAKYETLAKAVSKSLIFTIDGWPSMSHKL